MRDSSEMLDWLTASGIKDLRSALASRSSVLKVGAMYANGRCKQQGAMNANSRKVQCMRTTRCDLCKRQEPQQMWTATNGELYSDHIVAAN